ncbi:MAG: PEGA domain-containing protein [Opitutae bacterium]|nr:PEGA domain-containing protein [Opitutae bacterium]
MPRILCRLAVIVTLALSAATTSRAVTLRINVSPAGASIVTEAGQRLLAPASVELKRRDAPYTFVIEKPGYQTEAVAWSTREKQREISITLAPLSTDKEVTIKSEPGGAAVTIDGKSAGTTPLTTSATFFRDTKNSPWKPLAITVAKTDYQAESFSLPYDNPAASPVLAQLRLERVFNVETKAGDGSPIQAILTLADRELGPAPQKVSVVFRRADKTKAWPVFSLRGEIPTIYHPAQVTLTHDLPNFVTLSLKTVTELPVPLYAPAIEMSPTGARMVVNQAPHIATLETGERIAEIASLARVTRFTRRDQNPKAPLQAINSYAITPDGESAIFSITSQDDGGKFYSGLFLKRVEDDGGGIARLVDNNKRYFDANPVIAPDSNNILVFQSNRGDLSKPDIFRISFADNRTSGGVSRITNDQRFNYGPTYTDSNREVVYLSIEPNYPPARPQLSTVKFDGALPTQFQIQAEEVSHREHTKIYFTRLDESGGKRQIYAVEPDGRLETNLISDDSFLAANCFNPVASCASPVRILFVSDRDVDDQGRRNNNIYVMNADGSQIQQLTSNGSDDILPAWSPTDPNVVFFLSNRGGAYNLWRLRLK